MTSSTPSVAGATRSTVAPARIGAKPTAMTWSGDARSWPGGSFRVMSSATETIIDYLRDAETQEQASLSLLQGHLRGAPPGQYRSVTRRPLDETRRHARQVGERLVDLGATRSPLATLLTL